MKKILITLASTAALTLSSSAAVIVVGGTPLFSAADFSYTPAAIGNVLVAGTYSDNPASNITFGGAAATDEQTGGRSVFSYFVTTGTSSIDIEAVGGSGNGFFLYELTGVDTSSVVSSNTTTITTTSDDSFVISLISANGKDPTITPSGNIVKEIDQQVGGDIGGKLGAGSFTYGTAGSQDVDWSVTGGGTNTPQARLSYAFSPVPEPSSAAFLGLVGLALILCRRR